MNLQDLITQNNKRRPPRFLIYAIPGWGKSLMSASMPSPIIIDIEDGLMGIDVPSIPKPETYEQFNDYLQMLINDDHDYKTVVIDTISSLELLVYDKVCRDGNQPSIEAFGYGKGYQFAMKHWQEVIQNLEALRGKGIAPVILAHSEVRTINDPILDSYDKYILKLNKHPAGLFTQWADNVLFGTYRTTVAETKGTIGKKRGIGQGDRILYTEERPAFLAKSRMGLPYEIEIPKINGWDAISQFINNNNNNE